MIYNTISNAMSITGKVAVSIIGVFSSQLRNMFTDTLRCVNNLIVSDPIHYANDGDRALNSSNLYSGYYFDEASSSVYEMSANSGLHNHRNPIYAPPSYEISCANYISAPPYEEALALSNTAPPPSYSSVIGPALTDCA